ncbi:MAG: NAD(P)-dependent oxidoreductase [Deltaproteobacteria bacterium]|nr:NAD(P)-dependent oxidoreductase [Deltaproteobacteria bacterium]
MVTACTHPLASDLDLILDQTVDLWEEVRGRRIFITGGTGFFGSWLLESFAWANDRLNLGAHALVLTRNPEAFARKAPHLASHPSIRFHVGEVRSFPFPEGPFSHTVHAATPSDKRNPEYPLVIADTVVEGTRRALDFAKHCGARKFLLTSTGAVYGRQPPEVAHLPEDYAGVPRSGDPDATYGKAKLQAEHLCAMYARRHGIEGKIARGFSFVGPYLPLDIHYAIGNFIRDGMNGGPVRVKGDGKAHRSYLYGADLAIWLWTILFQGKPCRPYNVGSEQDLTIEDLARRVAEAFTPPVRVQIAGLPAPGGVVQRYVPSTQRALKELGLRQYTPLSEAIRRTVQWYSAGLQCPSLSGMT